MSANGENYRHELDQICADTISANAATVDRSGTFPHKSVEALKAGGLLGVLSAKEVGGLGLGLWGAAEVVRRVAEECGSTAMVVCMHFCGTAVIEAHGDKETRAAAASGEHFSTLAFSEPSTRSHFWAPVSTANLNGQGVILNAKKSWVTSASAATAYVWSSKPISAEGISTLWLVPAKAKGLTIQGLFDGLGLRGNDSSPVMAENVHVPKSAMLGADGKGFDIMMSTVLPAFNVLNAACTIGLMEGAFKRTVSHVTATKHSDTGASLADLPTIRNYVARMRAKTDMARTLLDDTLHSLESQRADGMLRVLECKSAASDAGAEALDMAMRICGGAAFRKDVGVERYFRDVRAGGVMGPTTDVLYDFIGKAVCGLPLF